MAGDVSIQIGANIDGASKALNDLTQQMLEMSKIIASSFQQLGPAIGNAISDGMVRGASALKDFASNASPATASLTALQKAVEELTVAQKQQASSSSNLADNIYLIAKTAQNASEFLGGVFDGALQETQKFMGEAHEGAVQLGEGIGQTGEKGRHAGEGIRGWAEKLREASMETRSNTRMISVFTSEISGLLGLSGGAAGEVTRLGGAILELGTSAMKGMAIFTIVVLVLKGFIDAAEEARKKALEWEIQSIHSANATGDAFDALARRMSGPFTEFGNAIHEQRKRIEGEIRKIEEDILKLERTGGLSKFWSVIKPWGKSVFQEQEELQEKKIEKRQEQAEVGTSGEALNAAAREKEHFEKDLNRKLITLATATADESVRIYSEAQQQLKELEASTPVPFRAADAYKWTVATIKANAGEKDQKLEQARTLAYNQARLQHEAQFVGEAEAINLASQAKIAAIRLQRDQAVSGGAKKEYVDQLNAQMGMEQKAATEKIRVLNVERGLQMEQASWAHQAAMSNDKLQTIMLSSAREQIALETQLAEARRKGDDGKAARLEAQIKAHSEETQKRVEDEINAQAVIDLRHRQSVRAHRTGLDQQLQDARDVYALIVQRYGEASDQQKAAARDLEKVEAEIAQKRIEHANRIRDAYLGIIVAREEDSQGDLMNQMNDPRLGWDPAGEKRMGLINEAIRSQQFINDIKRSQAQRGVDQAEKSGTQEDVDAAKANLLAVTDEGERKLKQLKEKFVPVMADLAQSAAQTGNMIGNVLAESLVKGFSPAKAMAQIMKQMLSAIIDGIKKQVMANAIAAASEAAKSQAGVPVVGPILAGGAMVAMLSLVQGLLSGMPSAAGGWQIPDGVNPIMQAHAGEHVIPRDLAQKYEEGAPGAGKSMVVNISTLEPRSFEDYLEKNSDRVIDRLNEWVRDRRF